MERSARPWVLIGALALMTVGIAVLLLGSEGSGTGAENVGDDGTAVLTAPAPDRPIPTRERDADASNATTSSPRPSCKATDSNPGGDNNYIPDAPRAISLGRGFVIEGFVRAAAGCEPLPGVRVQVWLATATGTEQDNRASVLTDDEGRYRLPTSTTVAQFGEPNIHVAYDGDAYEQVFIRRVVDLDDRRAVVNLTLRER